MKTHSNLASRILGILTLAAAVGWLQPTVTYTDANSNVYSSVQDNITVTVGFAAGISVVASAATATPVSPSTLNTMVFTVNNIGNGPDSITVAESNSDVTVLTVTKYTFSAADYATLILLNEALAATSIAALGNAVITVEYSIATDKGGEPSIYTLTGTSRRDGTATDNDNTVVTPALTGAVAVTPDGGQSLTHLPSGGASPTYTFTFTVTNSQTGADDFNLVATRTGSAVITIVSVDGVGGASTTSTNLAGSGATQDIVVIYTVAGAAGAQDTLYLAATSVANGTNDQGFADMTVILANMAITKLAYRSDQTTLVVGTVLPGETIYYKVTVTNGGTAAASTVHVDDFLPSELTFISATQDPPTWTFSNTGNDLDADLTGTLAPAASRFFWIQVTVN